MLACVPSFADVLSVEMKGSNSLEFSLKTEQLILHSPKALCIKAMVELFMQELRQVSAAGNEGGFPDEPDSVHGMTGCKQGCEHPWDEV